MEPTKLYHVPEFESHWFKSQTSDEALEGWANDPNCIENELCAQLLSGRRLAHQRKLEERRQRLEDNPFDPRTEVSMDARRIVAHLWIIFVLLPIVIYVLFLIMVPAAKTP